MSRVATLLVWYGWTVAALLLLFGQEVPGRWLLCAAHFGIVLPAWWISRLRSVLAEVVAAIVLVPVAFTALGAFLPDLVPETRTWSVQELDAALGGTWALRLAEEPPIWLVEVTQFCYALFYFLPLLLGLALFERGRIRPLGRVSELVVVTFFVSYLGYLVFPVLPPYRYVDYGGDLTGGALQRFLWPLLYELEPIRENCMPSGHTMVTLAVVLGAVRFAPWQLLWLVPVSAFLILGTIVLRLHWLVDVLAAVPFLALALWLVQFRFWRSGTGSS